MKSQEDEQKYLPIQEGESSNCPVASFSENVTELGEKQHNSIPKNINMSMEPTLPGINDLTRPKTDRTPKPSETVIESNDKSVRRIFGLATKIPCLITVAQLKILPYAEIGASL